LLAATGQLFARLTVILIDDYENALAGDKLLNTRSKVSCSNERPPKIEQNCLMPRPPHNRRQKAAHAIPSPPAKTIPQRSLLSDIDTPARKFLTH
jgi:hypothetical protein